MGGYGSGGHNRTHGNVENYSKVDSFSFYDYLQGDKYLHYKVNVDYRVAGGKIIYHVQTKIASIDLDGGCCPLGLSRVANVDGKSQRLYFICPECGKRARYLYRKNDWYLCRKCAGLTYESQRKSGREELMRKMQYIVEEKLDYAYWRYEHPNVFLPDLQNIPKPRYMRWEKYNRLMQELRELQRSFLTLEMQAIKRFGKYI